jgi:small subunit ribosomal protein S17
MAEECNDKNCPKHGDVKVRGTTIEGVVVSDKPKNTVIVEREYIYFIPKYERYERRTTRISAHKPPCTAVKTGDRVKIGECRPISKTKSFVVIEVLGK